MHGKQQALSHPHPHLPPNKKLAKAAYKYASVATILRNSRNIWQHVNTGRRSRVKKRGAERPVMRAISRESGGGSCRTLTTSTAPPASPPTTTSPRFSPSQISLQTKQRALCSLFLFYYRPRVNKRNSPSIREKVSTESHEISDMNYWQSNGTKGVMLELKPESNRGEKKL